MIDFVFRFDPNQTGEESQPADAGEARRALIEGNRVFSRWMDSCRLGEGDGGSAQYIVPSGGLMATSGQPREQLPSQKPFAVVLGCSDARVPTEMIFGQGFNDLFVIRVAGNVLGIETQGSLDFSVAALRGSVRVLVVLGHTHCGAVKGAVEAYLEPERFWSEAYSPALRAIFQKIFVAVRESDNALRATWGPDAPTRPGFREALVEMAVRMNAAHTAYALRQVVGSADGGPAVLHGVYDVCTHQVRGPGRLGHDPDADVDLADAPTAPSDIAALALGLARAVRLEPAGA